MPEGYVVKIGGSLIDAVRPVMNEVISAGVPVLIVPGGGIFADAVRAQNPDDDAAHWEAIASMNRYGRFLSTFGAPVTDALAMPDAGTAVFLPETVLRRADPLPHSWDVTSDSIALWAAGRLGAPLLLVKSCAGDVSSPDFVDAYFSVLKKRVSVDVHAVSGRAAGEIARYFADRKATRLLHAETNKVRSSILWHL
ncbi:MAG: uridylate kinase [Methanocorpusculum sp.]|nr:uridylate kinase [Methanocorpusculum sp.]